MTQCIYCNKRDKEFNDEHIIPQFLGGFEGLNPVLKKQDGLVCKECNSVIFSALETIFKEDSEEGLFSQQLNLEGSNSVRILGRRLKIDSVPGFGESFASQMFPFLKVEGKELLVDLKSQIKVRNYADGYQVFPIEKLEVIKNTDNNKFKKLKERLSHVKGSDISIFLTTDSPEDNNLEEIIELLKDYNVTYKENARKFESTDTLVGKKLEINIQGTVDRDIARILAKIVFNYFIYCALKEKKVELVYRNEFKKIRDFINGDKTILLKEIITSIDEECILDIEKEQKRRLLGHIIVFKIEDAKIIGRCTLFGKRVYKIVLSDTSEFLKGHDFGCGHIFNPFMRIICNLSQQPKDNPTQEDIRVTFGLFKRT